MKKSKSAGTDLFEQPKLSANDAVDRVAKLAGVRERAVQEMRTRLQQEGFAEESIEEALKRAVNCGILDDGRYARIYIKSKLNSGWGAHRIEMELKRLGIIIDDIEGLSDENFDQEDQVKRAVQALAKHRSNSKHQHQAKYRFLISKGYSSSVTQTAINQSEAQAHLPS